MKTLSLTRAFSAGIPPDVVQSRPATYAKGLVASAPFRHRPATAGPDMAERKEMRVNDTPVVKGPTAQSRAPEPQHSATWRSFQVSPCLYAAKTITASGAAINATGIVQNDRTYHSSLSRIKSRKFLSFRGAVRRGRPARPREPESQGTRSIREGRSGPPEDRPVQVRACWPVPGWLNSLPDGDRGAGAGPGPQVRKTKG